MKRTLLIVLAFVLVASLLLTIHVNMRASSSAALPPPDPARLIQLPDGSTLPLSRLLLAADAANPERRPMVIAVPAPPSAPAQPLLDPSPVPGAPLEQASLDFAASLYPGMPWGPLFKLAEYHRMKGDLDQALALYQSVPTDDRDYPRARRRIALDILTLGRNDPQSAVAYANQAFHVNPFDGNSLEVLVRVYAGTLGFDVK